MTAPTGGKNDAPRGPGAKLEKLPFEDRNLAGFRILRSCFWGLMHQLSRALNSPRLRIERFFADAGLLHDELDKSNSNLRGFSRLPWGDAKGHDSCQAPWVAMGIRNDPSSLAGMPDALKPIKKPWEGLPHR